MCVTDSGGRRKGSGGTAVLNGQVQEAVPTEKAKERWAGNDKTRGVEKGREQ